MTHHIDLVSPPSNHNDYRLWKAIELAWADELTLEHEGPETLAAKQLFVKLAKVGADYNNPLAALLFRYMESIQKEKLAEVETEVAKFLEDNK